MECAIERQELFAAGVRNHISPVTVSLNNLGQAGSQTLAPAYAGPQGQFDGLDQVNVRLTPALKGLGVINLVLSVDGISSNTVSVDIR